MKHPFHRHEVINGIRAAAGSIYVRRFLEAAANIDIWRDDEEHFAGYCLDAPDSLPSGSCRRVGGMVVFPSALRTWG